MLDEVPSGWERQQLGSHVEFQNGFAFKPADWRAEGIPIVRIQNLNGGSDFNYYDGEVPPKFGIDDGDLLFCWSGSRGTSFGPRIWRGTFAWLNQHIFRCDPAPTIRKDFLNYLLLQMTVEIEAEAHGGAGLAHIKKSELVKFYFSLPPLAEQQRIAEILTSVDDTIRATEAVIAQTERVKLGVMEDLLTGGLGSDAISNGEVPDGWGENTLEALINGLDAGVSVNSQNEPATKDQKGVLKTSCVSFGYFEPLENKVVIEPAEQTRLKQPVQENTIIISRMNTPNLVGANAFVYEPHENLFLPDRLWAMKIDSETVEPAWLGYWVAHQYLSGRFSEMATGTSGSMKNLSKAKVKSLAVAVPSRSVQERISSTLSAIDDEIRSNKALLSQTKRLKQGLMSDLLTGRKRVI